MILEQLVLTCKRMKLRYLPENTYKKLTQNIKPYGKLKNMKLSEGNRQNHHVLELDNFYIYMNPNIQKTEIGVHWNWKHFCIKEMTLSRLKDNLQYERKMFTYYISNKGIQSRIYTELLYLKTKTKTVKNEKILNWIDISPKKIC